MQSAPNANGWQGGQAMTLTTKQRRMLKRAKADGATFQELQDAGGYETRGHAENALRKLMRHGLVRRSLRQLPLVAYEAV